MKSGMNLVALATELERQRDEKRDYLADTRKLTMTEDARGINIGNEAMPLTQHANRQLATKLDIPAQFYTRMQDKHPDLLRNTVNALFEREPQKTMIRTLDQRVRGIMSDSYRPLDNYDLADASLPMLREAGAVIESCNVTETKFYLKAVIPGLRRELPIPKGLVMGVGHNFFTRALTGAISLINSEVGASGLVVNPGTKEDQCTNLATFTSGFRAVHLGKKKGEDDDVSPFMSDGTKRLEDAAIWARLRDYVKAICEGKVMDKLVADLMAAREDQITGNPAVLVELFGKKNQLTEDEKGGLLRHLTNSGESTRYGLQWAVTRLAQDVADYDRASDLERLGGRVIELPRSEWAELAKAA